MQILSDLQKKKTILGLERQIMNKYKYKFKYWYAYILSDLSHVVASGTKGEKH